MIIILFIAFITFPIIGLAQTSETPVSPTEPPTTVSPTPVTVNPNTQYYCGDGKCDSVMGETTSSCEKDCPQTTNIRLDTCGDKICQTTESKSSCSVDCGYPWVCGDGICGGTETDWNCPQDCPKPEAPSVYCGDKICQSDENQRGCPIDCGYPWVCGDGICSGTDTSDNCPKDCLQPTITSAPTTFGGTTGGGVGTVSPAPTLTTAVTKCGFSTTKFCNECGAGVYKNVFVKCNDGSEITMGSASSCKPIDLWNQYANEACVNLCTSGGWGGWSDLTAGPIVCVEDGGGSGSILTPLPPVTTKPVEIPKATPVCYIGDNLMQKYNLLIVELQKTESDKTRTELITKEIIALKQQITAQQNECVRNVPQPTPEIGSRPAPAPAPQSMPTSQPVEINIPVAVSINHCNEVAQWETKIAYYKKISGLSNDDLKKSGFSREEIDKILQELSLGIEKVRGQCDGRENTPPMPRMTTITGSASIAETVKPVVVESGQEIGDYYKARIEKATSLRGEEKQIQELKALRDEIDGLISTLIKSRKELEVSELNTLVKEVKVSRGEIRADEISVKTTEKKILLNIGDRPVSVEPTAKQVLIRDQGLEVNADEIMIKENILSVGGVDVKMSASEVAEKLDLAPKAVELREEDEKAVYDLKIDERRKLFGLIPFNRQRTITADAKNGDVLSEHHPWYNFMTTKS